MNRHSPGLRRTTLRISGSNPTSSRRGEVKRVRGQTDSKKSAPLLQRRAAEIPPAAGLAKHLVAGCGHCDGVLELDEAALRLIELEVESVTGAAESRPDGTAPVGQEAGQSPAPSREIDVIPDWRLPEVRQSARGDLYDDVDGISSNTEGTSRGGTR